VVQQLGELAERYPAESVLRAAAFDLAQRVVTRAQDLGKHSARSYATHLTERVVTREGV
jgi:hypothetical protein